MRSRLAAALRHPVSALGVALTTSGAFVFLALVGLQALGFLENPYAGILVFILVPAVFLVGLLLIPAGLWLEGRRARARLAPAAWPRIDLNDPFQRRVLFSVTALTLVNVAILSMASYGVVEFSESQEFCGQTCHTVMEPEFVAHQNGPHARVRCVACHVGPGPGGFVAAKLNGTRQLWLALTGAHSRPVPTPLTRMPDVRTTCEQCHSPDRFVGDKVKVFHEHADDAANTRTTTTVRLHVGGAMGGTGSGAGIHWHMNRANDIEYVALDDKRERIPYVRVVTPDGAVREYFGPGVTAADVAREPRRRMDCLDCHNRPAHRFGASPERAVDAALGDGRISVTLPFVRREVVRALAVPYASHDQALPSIDRGIRAAMRSEPGPVDDAALRRAIGVAQAIYRTNVFPSMKIGWGTYPTQLGHMTSTGCFRCHDEEHKTPDGVAIRQECDLCHTIE